MSSHVSKDLSSFCKVITAVSSSSVRLTLLLGQRLLPPFGVGRLKGGSDDDGSSDLLSLYLTIRFGSFSTVFFIGSETEMAHIPLYCTGHHF